jgi:hypothetical protein
MVVLSLLFIFTKDKKVRSALILLCKISVAGVLGLVVLANLLSTLTTKKKLDKSDYYGEYIIDRNYFSGKQADWQ